MSEPLLTLEGLHIDHGGPPVIRGLSAAIPPDQVVALLGINGAGKTTLLQTIVGFLRPRRGRILFEGADVTALRSHEIVRRGIALVPQGRRIFPSLTVRENLQIARRGAPGRQWDVDGVLELFPALRMRLGNRGRALSGGEQQMLAWARALVTNPRLLLMDEPTEGLSPRLVRALQELIPRLRTAGVSIFLAEQNIEFACAVADTVLIIVNGEITREIARDDLVRQGLTGEAAVAALAASVQGLEPGG
jgi:branched-chain amino acid transport system ATP-binding protein